MYIYICICILVCLTSYARGFGLESDFALLGSLKCSLRCSSVFWVQAVVALKDPNHETG